LKLVAVWFMGNHMTTRSLFLCVLVFSGCGNENGGGVLTLEGNGLRLAIDRDHGSVSLTHDGIEVAGLHAGFVEALSAGRSRLHTTLGRSMSCDQDDETITCRAPTSGGLRAEIQIELDGRRPGVLFWNVAFENVTDAPVKVKKFHPFRLASDDGGSLRVGGDPAGVRILQNGSDEFIGFYVDLLAGDTPLSDPNQDLLTSEYSSFSNGHALAVHLDSGACLLCGFVELDWAIPLVAFGPDDLLSEARYPEAVDIGPGKTIHAGRAVFLLDDSPHRALETYADVVAEHHQVVLPPRPLSGWDSWYTVFQNTGISEAFILDNADGLSSLFGDFGLDSMQIDDGWQDIWGDWNAKTEFPSGMGAVADAIKAGGIMPELWMAPLSARAGSDFYRLHPDWFAEKSWIGNIIIDPDMHPFDLTRPETMERVRELGRRIAGWGYQSVKMDFAYHALFAVLPPDPDRTPTALYRQAIREFRSAVGPDVYFTNISMTFPNYGLVDAFRIGLDDWPCWDGGAGCQGYITIGGKWAQGIKPAVRMAARRYWMNGRIWWNHHDQLFFRDQSADEARAFASLVGISGGMISLGEEAANLTPGQADVFRRMLPLLGRTARPLDLFEREYPEVWHLALEDGHILGLFHWGQNNDLTTNPYTPRPDGAPLIHNIDLASLGLDPAADHVSYEFWTGEMRDGVDESFVAELPPHTGRIYKIVEKRTEPFFLATNRHMLMGPHIVENVAWDPAARALTGRVRTAPGYSQALVFYLPAGHSVTTVTVEEVDYTNYRIEGGFLTVTFDGRDADWHPFSIELGG
jgi:hypothetical protein